MSAEVTAGWDPTPATRRSVPGSAVAALLLLVSLSYAPSLTGGFVWDDIPLIRDNAALRTWQGARRAAFGDLFGDTGAPHSGYRRPVPVLLNAATLAVVGPSPAAFRITNLLLHLGAVLLLLLLLRRLGLERLPALVGAALFGLHPVQTEAVAFVSARPDLLTTTFGLGTLLAYVWARRAVGPGASMRRTLGYGTAGLGLVLALGSKESALLLPWLVAAAEALGLVGPRGDHGWRRWGWTLGLLGLGGTLVLARLLLAGGAGEAPVFVGWGRWVAAGNLTALYARLLVAPVGLRLTYSQEALAALGPLTVLGWALLPLAGAAAWLLRRRLPRVSLGLVWIGLPLLPVLHLVSIASVAAERYLYLPCAGLAVVAAAGLTAAMSKGGAGGGRGDRARWALGVGVALALLGSAAGTARRASDWSSEVSLWSAELGHGEPTAGTLQNLAAALAERGHLSQAAQLMVRAWELSPGHPVIYRTLVRLLAQGALPGSQPLSPELRRGALPVLLDPAASPSQLRGWAERLLRQGHPTLANVVMQKVRATPLPSPGPPTP